LHINLGFSLYHLNSLSNQLSSFSALSAEVPFTIAFSASGLRSFLQFPCRQGSADFKISASKLKSANFILRISALSPFAVGIIRFISLLFMHYLCSKHN